MGSPFECISKWLKGLQGMKPKTGCLGGNNFKYFGVKLRWYKGMSVGQYSEIRGFQPLSETNLLLFYLTNGM